MSKFILISCMVIIISIAGCNGQEGVLPDIGPQKTLEAEVATETRVAALKSTENSIATVQQISVDATRTVAARAIATNEAAEITATAFEVLQATQEASGMVAFISRLYDEGVLPDSTGVYYRVEDFDENRAKINYYAWYETGFSPGDFVLQSKIQYDTASRNSNWENSGCGFVFRDSAGENHYRVIPALDGNLYFTALLNGEKLVYEIAAYGDPELPAGEMTLALLVDGTHIMAWVNDLLVLDEQNDLLSEGGLAYSISSGTNLDYGMHCNISDIELWVLEE